MRVLVRPCDEGPCGMYRLVWPARAAASEIEVRIADRRWETMDRDWLLRLGPWDTDLVVLQRPSSIEMVRAVGQLRERGVSVVVEMDDDLSQVHPNNAFYVWAQEHHDYAEQACKDASLVTVTTPALAERYAPHGRYRVVPNYIPQRYLSIPHVDKPTIGWGGAVEAHPGDLNVVGDAIKNLVAEGVNFMSAGPTAGVGRVLGLNADPVGPGGVLLDQWPNALARFGIGIAPLAMTGFNHAKSRLKPLEYAAVGVPWVGSPIPDYVDFHHEGCGEIVLEPYLWEQTLRRLVDDQQARFELADAGREVARANTIEGNAWRWIEAWSDALKEDK